MSETKQQIKSGYPLPVYNYRVTIQSEKTSLAVSFAEVSGLNMEYEPILYKHGLSFISGQQIVPGMQQAINITLKRGVTANNTYLHEWLDDVYRRSIKQKYKRDIVIDLCDEGGQALIRWQVKNAMPTKLQMPSFDASSNEVAIETMELVAHSLRVEHIA